MTVKPQPFETEAGSPNVLFTARQMQVLKLLAVGKHNREVAVELKISTKTVEKHRENIYDKIGIDDVRLLVHYAIRFKHVPLMEFQDL